MTLASADQQYLLESMRVQKKLIQARIEEMQAMNDAIDSTMNAIQQKQELDWNRMFDLIHLTAVEWSLQRRTRSRF